MVTKDSEWVDATNKQLDAEAGKKNSVSKKLSFTDGLDIHAPVEPIPDNDWVGETWGLFWPDQELEDKSEDPTKFVKKHYEDKTKKASHPPANLKASMSSVDVLTCPRPKTPTPPPPPKPQVKPQPPPPQPAPAVVMRKKKTLPPPPPLETVFEQKEVNGDNSKWSWLRSEDKSAGRARFSLSIYW